MDNLQQALNEVEWERRAAEPSTNAAHTNARMVSYGASLIFQERQRQISEEGYTLESDDRWVHGELYIAAECYACLDDFVEAPELWPWDKRYWKPKDRISNLVRAGALLAAEIDRLMRVL